MAEAVRGHPSAFAAELMNEPMTIWRTSAFDTYREVGQAINSVIPDMSVSVCDVGEGAVIPDWVIRIVGGSELISAETLHWIKTAGTVFYPWHWYHIPLSPFDALHYATTLGASWGIPTFATEFSSASDCQLWNACVAANVSHFYWHYSAYCTTGPDFGNRQVPSETFGACILGWAGGISQYIC